jgi:hypothetical protein
MPPLKALHAQVTEDKQHEVRMRAAELRMSIADYLRTLVDADLQHKWLTVHGPKSLGGE